MARVTPGSGSSEKHVEAFKDLEPYIFTLAAVEMAPPSDQDFGKSLLLTWSYDELPEITLRTYAPLRLGERKGGKVAKLRAILNALSGRPEQAPIEWFEDMPDGTFEFKYPGEAQPRRLEPGAKLVGRGSFTPRDDGTVMFRLEVFRALAAPATQEPALPLAEPAAPAATPRPASPSVAPF